MFADDVRGYDGPTQLAHHCTRWLLHLGRRSWGVYLGHIILHECLFLRTPPWLARPLAGLQPRPMVLVLLIGGLAFDTAASALFVFVGVEGRRPGSKHTQDTATAVPGSN